MSGTVHETAYAKLNLFLEVKGKRDDGHHELETVMHEIDLTDGLTLTAGGSGVRLNCSDTSLDCGESNLCVKAVRAVEQHVKAQLPCVIDLEKRIPAGGGLGGGSSDAAAVIRALDRLYELGLTAPEMEAIGGTFGSDISFFVRGGTSFCTGRGEVIEPVDFAQELCFVLLLPGLHVSTRDVFAALQLTDSPRAGYDFPVLMGSHSPTEIRKGMFNRLESAARAAFPGLERLFQELVEFGPVLSGSGSTAFVLCDGPDHAVEVRDRMAKRTECTLRIASSAERQRGTA